MKNVSLLLAVCCFVALASCSDNQPIKPANSADHVAQDDNTQANRLALPGVAGTPTPDHIVICIMENHASTQVIGSANAPYITALSKGAYSANFTNSFAITHPSQPNYLQLYSGSNQGVTGDSRPRGIPYKTANLGRQLINTGKSFATYSEDLPYQGYDGNSSGAYARKHNPAANWVGTGTNQIPSSTNKSFTAFPTDFTKLPTVCYVVPNLNNDMHDGSVSTGDNWIKNKLGAYIEWAKTHNSLFILTFDEDDYSLNNKIATVFTGSMVKAGSYSTTINHYSVLRTVEDMYGLPYAGNAASAQTINFCWK